MLFQELSKHDVCTSWTGEQVKGETYGYAILVDYEDPFHQARALNVAKGIVSGLKELGYTFDTTKKPEPQRSEIFHQEGGFNMIVLCPNVPNLKKEQAEVQFAKDLEKVCGDAYAHMEKRFSKTAKAHQRAENRAALAQEFERILQGPGNDEEKIHRLVETAFNQLSPGIKR